MEKENKSKNFKLLAILLISNIIVYLLSATPPEVQYQLEESIFQPRKDYIDLKIQANLNTSFIENKPISIISKNQKLFIPFAILRKQIIKGPQSDFSSSQSTNEFIVHIPKTKVQRLINMSNLDIIPYGIKIDLNKNIRASYEISI
jgi:hypothetical protein